MRLQAAAAGPAAAQVEREAPQRELPPRPSPYGAPPMLRPYTEDFSDCFGNVRRTEEPAPPAAGYGQGYDAYRAALSLRPLLQARHHAMSAPADSELPIVWIGGMLALRWLVHHSLPRLSWDARRMVSWQLARLRCQLMGRCRAG